MANYNNIPMCSALRLQRTPTDTMVLSLTRWVETENSKGKTELPALHNDSNVEK